VVGCFVVFCDLMGCVVVGGYYEGVIGVWYG